MWNKNKYEEYAINILDFFYPCFSNMVKGESPDYHNSIIGVEITRAITTKDGEVNAFCKKNINKRFNVIPEKQLKKFGFKELPLASDSKEIIFTQRSRQNGCLYYYKEKKTGDLVFFMYLGKSKTNESTTDDIIYAISKKLKKLNNNYNLFSRNDLCILIQEQLNYYVCQEEIIDGLINIFISSAEELYNKTNWINKFDNIFLLFIDNLFCINTKTWEYERKIITKEHIDQVFSNAGL